MKWIQNTSFLLFVSMIVIVLGIGFFYRPREDLIEEEAFPIREEDTITGMDYVITIGEKEKDKSFVISSHILDSILHYKEKDNIDNFLIRLKIENKSSSDYLLKSIRIIDDYNHTFVEDVSYRKDNDINQFSFQLSKNFFDRYQSFYKIQIELEK